MFRRNVSPTSPFVLANTDCVDRVCGLVALDPETRVRSRRYQISWEVMGLERVPLSLVSTTEELFGRKSSGSGLEIREHGRGDPVRWPRDTFCLQTLTLATSTSGGRSVGIVRSRTQAMEVAFLVWAQGTDLYATVALQLELMKYWNGSSNNNVARVRFSAAKQFSGYLHLLFRTRSWFGTLPEEGRSNQATKRRRLVYPVERHGDRCQKQIHYELILLAKWRKGLKCLCMDKQ
jgi:hypothetical protein